MSPILSIRLPQNTFAMLINRRFAATDAPEIENVHIQFRFVYRKFLVLKLGSKLTLEQIDGVSKLFVDFKVIWCSKTRGRSQSMKNISEWICMPNW